jgi:hypothetical protein
MSQARFFSIRSCVSGVAGMALGLGVALPAAAEGTFPAAIQKQVDNACAPQCILCHTTPSGGRQNLKPNPVTTEGYTKKNLPNGVGEGLFIANVIALQKGLPDTDAKLENVLKLMATTPCNETGPQPCDSDGDGMIDTDELKKNRDPDLPNDQEGSLCAGPKYGCGATISALPRERTATREAAAVTSLLGVALVFLRRVRRR